MRPAVLCRVPDGEFALEDVRAPSAVVDLLIAPRVFSAVEPAARRVLPFGLGGQAAPGPVAVCLRVIPAHVDDRVITDAVERRARVPRVCPVRPRTPSHHGVPSAGPMMSSAGADTPRWKTAENPQTSASVR